MATITTAEVWDRVTETVKDMLDDLARDCDRETLIERLDEECDTLWSSLVQHGRIDQYTVRDLIDTAPECGVILDCAEEHAWVEDNNGLWDGLTYGVLASIAYFSLRNLMYSACKDEYGVDSNDDQPLENYGKNDDSDE